MPADVAPNDLITAANYNADAGALTTGFTLASLPNSFRTGRTRFLVTGVQIGNQANSPVDNFVIENRRSFGDGTGADHQLAFSSRGAIFRRNQTGTLNAWSPWRYNGWIASGPTLATLPNSFDYGETTFLATGVFDSFGTLTCTITSRRFYGDGTGGDCQLAFNAGSVLWRSQNGVTNAWNTWNKLTP